MFDFSFVCHHSAAAWASSLAHSLGVERSRQFLLQPPTQTPGLSDCIFLCLSYITLSVCLSVCHKDRRGVWLTLWVVTEQLWGVSPPAAKCRGRAAQLLRLAGRSCTDWSGRGAATTIPAQLIPALTCPPTSSSTQQVTPHLMPELAPCNFFRSNPFMQLGRCCWHRACASKIRHLHFSNRILGGHLKKKEKKTIVLQQGIWFALDAQFNWC